MESDDQEIPDPSNAPWKVVSSGSNGRCQTNANQTDLAASNPPSISDIQAYVNARWGNQANIFFTVNPTIQEIDVNYDLDRDRKLQVPNLMTGTDNDEIDAMIQSAPTNTINMYWAGVDFSNLNVLGIGRPPSNTWFASNTLANQTRARYTIAHEMGHALGREGHTSEDSLALEYQRDLMYYAFIDPPSFNQCRVRQPDWELVNR